VKRKEVFKLDLAQIEGEGDISCPKCGTAISPDDDTEGTYSIVEPKVNSHGLKEIVIQCNRCASKLYLTGFSLLDQLGR
jgi:DNA-directed RNA polymerase subunit RPC12/RpoP